MSDNIKSIFYIFIILVIIFFVGNFLNFNFNKKYETLPVDCETLSGAELFLKCGKQNINSVNEETLSSISGISTNLAKAIIEKRNDLNEFKSWNDVDKVKGVGEKRLLILKNYLFVSVKQ